MELIIREPWRRRELNASGIGWQLGTVAGFAKRSDARGFSFPVSSGLFIFTGELAEELRQLLAESRARHHHVAPSLADRGGPIALDMGQKAHKRDVIGRATRFQ